MSTTPPAASRLVCAGCGTEVPPTEVLPFRCPRAGIEDDDTDHVLRRVLEPQAPAAPTLLSREEAHDLFLASAEPNPFLRYRRLLHSHFHALHHRGITDGEITDEAFAGRVRTLDRAVAAVEGREHGFRETPFGPENELGAALGLGPGQLWVKDETGNISGSHKARHLFGVLLWLDLFAGEIASNADKALAIASCGNAALAAAVVARAAGRRLDVYVPPDAHPGVLARLRELGARLVPCPRQRGEAGDPCFLRFREAVTGGSLPFTCQGPENGLVIEGGKTLAWEMVSAWLRGRDPVPDRLFIQVGGGALASAVVQGFAEARRLGVLDHLPKIHAVQTRGASPLARAWRRVAERALGERATSLSVAALAVKLTELPPAELDAALRHAATHRSRYMWPWEEEPRSLATGILDDETYDWLAVVEGMAQTGGYPVVATEAEVAEAHRLARRHTEIATDPTGTAGLAGLLQLRQASGLAPEESAVVLFTGRER